MDPTRRPTSPPFDPDDPDCPFAAAMTPTARKFAHEDPEMPLSAAAMIANRAHLQHVLVCTCSGIDDVHARSEEIGIAAGCTPGRAGGLINQHLVLGALPRLLFVLEFRSHLRPEYLRVITDAIVPVLEAGADEGLDIDVPRVLEQMEPEVLAAVLPIRDGQKMFSTRRLHILLQGIIQRYEVLLRPPDLEQPFQEREQVVFTDDGHSTAALSAIMDRDKAAEVKLAIDAVADEQGCSQVDALVHLARQASTVDVALNLYCHLNGGPIFSTETGWLEGMAAREWLDRVSSIRIITDSVTEGYRPTEAQRAFIIARDGVCMSPGCEIPADRCQLDHIEPYNHGCPIRGWSDGHGESACSVPAAPQPEN